MTTTRKQIQAGKPLTQKLRYLERQIAATERASYVGCAGFASNEDARGIALEALQTEYANVLAARNAILGR